MEWKVRFNGESYTFSIGSKIHKEVQALTVDKLYFLHGFGTKTSPYVWTTLEGTKAYAWLQEVEGYDGV